MTLPRKLSIIPVSPNFDRNACARVDKVYVDGVHLPDCVAYDMDAGWALKRVNGIHQPKQHGKITVTEK